MKAIKTAVCSLLVCVVGITALDGCASHSVKQNEPTSDNGDSSLILRYEQLLAVQSNRIDELLEVIRTKTEQADGGSASSQKIESPNKTDSDLEKNSDKGSSETARTEQSETEKQPPNGTQSAPQTDAEKETEIRTAPPMSETVFTYEITDGGVMITGLTETAKNLTELVVPAILDGYAVVTIADRAFTGLALQTVKVESGIREIGWFAFYGCTSLSSVTLPDSVTSIGYSAFDGVARDFVIQCNDDSYAKRYAVSFAIRWERCGS